MSQFAVWYFKANKSWLCFQVPTIHLSDAIPHPYKSNELENSNYGRVKHCVEKTLSYNEIGKLFLFSLPTDGLVINGE